ncbi:MAG TPA: penicillin-binding transpeptidase domain-containing protein [Candidatus Paceibacterota bacterium]|nr:penicillin-binding transpeptidase domain-containing protein [Candidatus Paceibacterota bacterium]
MKWWKRKVHEIQPEEIFLDSSNLPERNSSQFEGRIGKPVSGRAILGVGAIFFLVVLSFSSRAFFLQIAHGASYADISRNNTLDKSLIFATRGIIYDQNGAELAWNTPASNTASASSTVLDAVATSTYALRKYISEPGFADLLGFVRYPQADSNGEWWQSEYSGVGGLEQEYNTLLSGVNGASITETNAHDRVVQTNIVTPPQDGQNLTLSIDAAVQTELYKTLLAHAREQGFRAGAGVIMDVHTGQVLALTSFPEYSNQGFTDGDVQAVSDANTNPLKPMLNRAIAGLYSPGSIVKTIFAAGALDEGIISPTTQIDATGEISIPNPYDPSSPSIFKDWTSHGWIDMEEAIAVSSDQYFYTIGGGYNGQQGLGISGLDKYADMFGLASTTGIDLPGEVAGIVPSPAWKAANFPNDPTWRLGDTYHTAIGGYSFLTTPVEAVRYAAAIANGGTLLVPHLIASSTPITSTIPISDSDLAIVRAGMRLAVTSSRKDATIPQLNIPGIDIAAKTGTAQIGTHNQFVNSWSIGFWPADNPKYAFAVVLEQGPSTETAGVAVGMVPFFEWLVQNEQQYVN